MRRSAALTWTDIGRDIRIEVFKPEQSHEVSRMLARAFVTNPLHVAALGPSQLARNEAFFRTGLAVMKGRKLIATDGRHALGLIHWVASAHCQFSYLERLRMAPAMVRAFGIGSALRVGSWLTAWSTHDPREPHSHLGPVGVSPEAQGRHIGHQLMEHYCDEADRVGEAGYLETDRPENVRFYRRFGFETTERVVILGVPNYLMWRPARSVRRVVV